MHTLHVQEYVLVSSWDVTSKQKYKRDMLVSIICYTTTLTWNMLRLPEQNCVHATSWDVISKQKQ